MSFGYCRIKPFELDGGILGRELAVDFGLKVVAAALPGGDLTAHGLDAVNGNEKHAELLKALPTNASRAGTIRNGDLMLYGSNTLVVFYMTFDSSYTYTRLGRTDDSAGLAQALGQRAVRINFSKK